VRIAWGSYATVARLLLLTVLCAGWAGEPRGPVGNADRGRPRETPAAFRTEFPAYKGNVILGRPTDRSVTLSVLAHEAADIDIAYGPRGQALNRHAAAVTLHGGEPREVVLEGLDADTAYEYRILNAESGEPLFPEGGRGVFRTCRTAGSPFMFTVQADSHLDEGCLPELYRTTLANALADQPDFHIDLGDTFMTGKHDSRDAALLQYAAQRYYLGLIGHAAPVFLVIGNHDGEETKNSDATRADGLAVWSCTQRKRLFPNPVPDAFYTGNTVEQPPAGLLQDYYAWTWGDALFVVLDPYWTSRPTRGGREPWNMTLGKAQYDWLARTLRASRAKYKFVFIHQLVGGLGPGRSRRRRGGWAVRMGWAGARRPADVRRASPRVGATHSRVAGRDRRQHRIPRP